MNLKPLLGTLVAAVALAGCAPAGGGSAPSVSGSQSVAPAPNPGGNAIDDFLARLAQGMATTTSYAFVMTLSNDTEQLKSSGEADTSDKALVKTHSTLELGGQVLELITIGNDSFVNMGGTWYKSGDPTDQQVDPVAAIVGSRKYLKAITPLGPDSVDGLPADHYRVTMDPAVFGKTGIEADALDYDIWIDADNRLRKLSMDMPSLKLKTEFTVGDYNKPVSIKAPEKYQEG
ncbi:MAG: hypothetical protein LWW77_09675 [Propionibacteriales bacterium]|nr:hypothetical protein [Propionibacteriales bacterium]